MGGCNCTPGSGSVGLSMGVLGDGDHGEMGVLRGEQRARGGLECESRRASDDARTWRRDGADNRLEAGTGDERGDGRRLGEQLARADLRGRDCRRGQGRSMAGHEGERANGIRRPGVGGASGQVSRGKDSWDVRKNSERRARIGGRGPRRVGGRAVDWRTGEGADWEGGTARSCQAGGAEQGPGPARATG